MKAISHNPKADGITIEFPDKEVLKSITPRPEGAPVPQAKIDFKELTKEQILEVFQTVMAEKAKAEAVIPTPEKPPVEEEEKVESPTEKKEEPEIRPDLAPPPGKTVGPTTLPPPGKTTTSKTKTSKKPASKKTK